MSAIPTTTTDVLAGVVAYGKIAALHKIDIWLR